MENKLTNENAGRIQSNPNEFSQNQYFKKRSERSAKMNSKYLTEEESLDILKIGKRVFHNYVNEGHIKYIITEVNEKKYARFDVERLGSFILDD